MTKGSKWFALALALTCAACGGGDADTAAESPEASAAPPSGEQDLGSLNEYELTMDRIDRYFQTQRNMMEALKDMTPAEREAANVAMDADASLDEMVAQAEASALVSEAARAAGLSTREFVMISFSLFQSMMASSVAQMQPNVDQDSLIESMNVNPANVQFVRENEAALRQKQQEIQAEMEAAGVEGGG
jgi:hypothetical protein